MKLVIAAIVAIAGIAQLSPNFMMPPLLDALLPQIIEARVQLSTLTKFQVSNCSYIFGAVRPDARCLQLLCYHCPDGVLVRNYKGHSHGGAPPPPSSCSGIDSSWEAEMREQVQQKKGNEVSML